MLVNDCTFHPVSRHCPLTPHSSYPFSAGQVQVQQTMNQDEYQAMQERENAIAQLEVQETRLQREMREEEDRELAKLENDITTMAEVFVETQKLVTEQGEVVGKLTFFSFLLVHRRHCA